MGTGTTHDSECPKPPSLWALEQLRVLVMYEFEPPLNSRELVEALRACNNHVEHACQYLKASRPLQGSIAIPSSAPVPRQFTNMVTPEREKRRRSISPVDDKGTPSKRPKDLTALLTDTVENKKEHEGRTIADPHQDVEMPSSAPDCANVQQLLVETVEDRAASNQPLRNPDWVNQVWTMLHVPAVVEVTMHLNSTVDALVTWVKGVDTECAHDIQAQGAALIVEVVASLPPRTIENTVKVACLPTDEVLAKKDSDVDALAQVENEAADWSAYARANAAKSAIESLSAACKAYMDRLAWFKDADEQIRQETADAKEVLEVLSRKLGGLVETCARDVKEAEFALGDAKQKKEARSLEIVEFVHQRRQELLEKGETEASATLDSVVGVWKKDDVEMQALWSSRSECERQVKASERALRVAEHALAFHNNLQALFQKHHEQCKEALMSSSNGLNRGRELSNARATAALKRIVPMLARALYRYYDFHSIQQSKAKEELHDQETALAAHNEYFGDSAPIKKGDIEQRIREFIGVKQNSMHVVMEIADRQQQLWEDKQRVLPESVRSLLIDEFKAFWIHLSGPMQDVIRKFVTTIEKAAGGAVAIQAQEPMPESSISTSGGKEQVIPAFTEPALLKTHVDAITPYRTAISPVIAQNETKCLRNEEMEQKTWTTALPIDNSGKGVSVSTPSKAPKAFKVGSIMYSKITAGGSCTRFVRGVVRQHLGNDMYMMQYDNGDNFSVGGSFLFTKELMEQSLKMDEKATLDQDAEMGDAEQVSSESVCGLM